MAKQPTALVDAFNKAVSVPRDSSGNPVFETAPVVPEGGFLPTSEVRRSPSSVSEVSHSIDSKSDELNTEEVNFFRSVLEHLFLSFSMEVFPKTQTRLEVD